MEHIRSGEIILFMMLLVAPLYVILSRKLIKEQAGERSIEEYLDERRKYSWSKEALIGLLVSSIFTIPGVIIFFDNELVPINGILGMLFIGIGFWLGYKYDPWQRYQERVKSES